MTLPPPGGWTRRGPRQIMRPSSLFTSPADAFKGCAYGSRRNVSIPPSKAGRGADRPRGATQERVRRGVGINFAIVISSQRCACRCTACARSLSRFFDRGRHGQESEEGKEDREGSHQESGKEDLQEEEVAATRDRALATSRSQPRTQSETSPKDMKCPLQPFGIAASKIRPDPCAGGCCIMARSSFLPQPKA